MQAFKAFPRSKQASPAIVVIRLLTCDPPAICQLAVGLIESGLPDSAQLEICRGSTVMRGRVGAFAGLMGIYAENAAWWEEALLLEGGR